MKRLSNKYESAIGMRNRWIEVLTADLIKLPRKSRALTVGIVGALGSGDVGDEAMLIALSSELREKIPELEIICFSINPALSYSYTGIISKTLLEGILSPYRNVFYALSLAFNKLETALTKILSTAFRTDEVYRGGWILRIFYVAFTKLVLFTLSRRQRSRSERGVNRHIRDILSLDALIYQGGAYINSWNIKSAIYSYLFPARVATKSKIPVYASGLNLGPYNIFDRWQVRNIIKHFRLIGLRDYSESVNYLVEMGIFDDQKHTYSCDDAINLTPNPANDITRFVDDISPYIALNLHYWNLNREEWRKFSLKLATIIGAVVTRHGINIVPVSMAFSDSSEQLDVSAMKDVFSLSGLPDSRFVLPPKPMSIGSIKTLYEKAALTIGTRHHAMVLSVSSETPTIAIAYDNYYKMKHEGVGRYFKENFHVYDSDRFEILEVIEIINVIISGSRVESDGFLNIS